MVMCLRHIEFSFSLLGHYIHSVPSLNFRFFNSNYITTNHLFPFCSQIKQNQGIARLSAGLSRSDGLLHGVRRRNGLPHDDGRNGHPGQSQGFLPAVPPPPRLHCRTRRRKA